MMDDCFSNELQLDSSPGIFDIHAIDTELLSEVKEALIYECFQPAFVGGKSQTCDFVSEVSRITTI